MVVGPVMAYRQDLESGINEEIAHCNGIVSARWDMDADSVSRSASVTRSGLKARNQLQAIAPVVWNDLASGLP